MKINKTIGLRINELLAIKNIKQKELAKVLGVTDNTISYFVSGKRTPNISQIIEIAKFFDVSTDYILGLSKTPTSDPNIATIGDYTGLKKEAIYLLHVWNKNEFGLPLRELYTEFTNNFIISEQYHSLVFEFGQYIQSLDRCKLIELNYNIIDFSKERKTFNIAISKNSEVQNRINTINKIKESYNKEIDDVQALKLFKMQKLFTEFIKKYGQCTKDKVTTEETDIEKPETENKNNG